MLWAVFHWYHLYYWNAGPFLTVRGISLNISLFLAFWTFITDAESSLEISYGKKKQSLCLECVLEFKPPASKQVQCGPELVCNIPTSSCPSPRSSNREPHFKKPIATAHFGTPPDWTLLSLAILNTSAAAQHVLWRVTYVPDDRLDIVRAAIFVCRNSWPLYESLTSHDPSLSPGTEACFLQISRLDYFQVWWHKDCEEEQGHVWRAAGGQEELLGAGPC